MSPARTLDEAAAVDRLQDLIRVNFVGRDELHAAAALIENRPLANVCQRLSDHLGGRAAELQQWVLALGHEPIEPSAEQPTLANARTRRAAARAPETVLAHVVQHAHRVREFYDAAIASAPDGRMAAMLTRHQEDAEFSEDVLLSIDAAQPMKRTDEPEDPSRTAQRRRPGSRPHRDSSTHAANR